MWGAPGWLSWLSVQLQLGSWSHSSWVWASHWALCWQLRAWSLLQIVCLPLFLPLPWLSLCLCLSLSVSKINKHWKKNFFNVKLQLILIFIPFSQLILVTSYSNPVQTSFIDRSFQIWPGQAPSCHCTCFYSLSWEATQTEGVWTIPWRT